jgi:hypothetical protein
VPALPSEYGVDIGIITAIVVPVERDIYLANMFLGNCYGQLAIRPYINLLLSLNNNL